MKLRRRLFPRPLIHAEKMCIRDSISSGTRSSPEGCALCELSCPVSCPVSCRVLGLEVPVAGPFGCWSCMKPEDRTAGGVRPRPARVGLGLARPGLDRAGLGRTGLASAGLHRARSSLPRPGTGRRAASPSGKKSAAWRIDLALQRIGSWSRFPADPGDGKD